VEPKYNEEEAQTYAKQEVVVPEIRNLSLQDAAKVLADQGLQFDTEPATVEDPKVLVVDQFPKPGAKVPEKSIIILYLKKDSE
jgi:stage V sporulation protein D (sporulation-specific penicillin-binding protein)